MSLPTGNDDTEAVSGGLIDEIDGGEDCPEWSSTCTGDAWIEDATGVMDPRTYGTGGDATQVDETLNNQQGDYTAPSDAASGLYDDLAGGVESWWNETTPDFPENPIDAIPLWLKVGAVLVLLVLLSDYAELGAAALDRS